MHPSVDSRLARDDGFRWRARAWHLTYCGHVPHERLLALLDGATSIKTLGTSVVHESSNAEVPYDHTHLAWWHLASRSAWGEALGPSASTCVPALSCTFSAKMSAFRRVRL